MAAALVYSAAAEFATEHRGWFVTFFVLPVSLVYDAWFSARAWLVRRFYSAPKLHAKRVRDIQRQLADVDASGAKGRLVTARGGWQSITPGDRTYKKRGTQISINLYDILDINVKERWVHVEPMVNMGQLSHFLIERGFTIPVLPELDDLTVGGLMMGVGIETSSHRYGLFNDTVIEAEVVLADGTVVVCSRDESRDLFDVLPWSYGTVCFLLSVKIQIVPCKPYVRIEYIPCTTREEGIAKFRELSEREDAPDFVEGLQYSSQQSVVMPSSYVGEDEIHDWSRVNDISRWYKPWFFKHVESFLASGKAGVEYIPLRAYFHRHSRSIFWEMSEIVPFGNHPVYRWLLGWAVPPKVSFLKMTQTAKIREMYEKQHVIQDMLVPISRMSAALDVFDELYGVYPLWLCPYRAYDYSKDGRGAPHRCFLRKPENLIPGKDYEMYVDLGAYGVPRAVKEKKPFDVVKNSQMVERWVMDNHGFQMLYATSYLSLEDFRAMFDHTHYDALKARLDPKSRFPTVFEKTCKQGAKMWEGGAAAPLKAD